MRIALFVVAGVLGLFSLGLLAGGGALLWGDAQKDEQGYLSTSHERLAGNGYALATDNLDMDADGAGWILDRDRYGEIRVEVSSHDGKPVFVGIARTRDVTDYLRGSEYDLVSDVSYSPFRADYRQVSGNGRPQPPTDQRFWAASASGAGTQAITWDVDDGDWSVVVMNADASRGVDASVKAGAQLPFLTSLGWGTLIAGLVTLVIAATLAIVAMRAPQRRPVAV
jgi:hypothetical protein